MLPAHPAHPKPPFALFWAIAQFPAHAMFSSPALSPSSGVGARVIARRAGEVCQYHAVGVQGTPALPYNRQTTLNGPNPSPPITIIFQQLGGHYAVDVSCQGTGNSAAFSPVIY